MPPGAIRDSKFYRKTSRPNTPTHSQGPVENGHLYPYVSALELIQRVKIFVY